MRKVDRKDWINSGQEAALDPDRRMIDAHHHLWRRNGASYLAADLREDATRSHYITHTVFVECLANYYESGPERFRPVGETEFVAGQARLLEGSEPQVGGIVAFADLTLGTGVADVMEAHENVTRGLLRGVRHALAWDPSPEVGRAHTKPPADLMEQAEFLEGVRTLGRSGYVFDAWVYHPQLVELAELARRTPETTVVVNHLGCPLRTGPYATDPDVTAEWRRGVELLGKQPNCVMKLGGIGMDHLFELGWSELPRPPTSDVVATRWRDEVLRCIDAFGPDRCMFESNYPVDRQTLPYSVIWNAFQIIAEPFDEAEKDRLFWSTAATVYSLAV